ncbi:MAG: tRNA (N(6)-L-threonylcarbamoyladenosine(37)-C(2))-methylthiotransferase MtaB [Chloroflexi bacterium]|nr:tRNA (N(6)-L-threonylcarbamoyladenosine(37)-C(2))-methylthiotransferase MtaB [Chloroflexota bacterium]
MLCIYFTALGCKLNQAEVESLAREAGCCQMSVTSNLSEADWAVVNSCAVTQTAAQKTRQAVGRLHEQNPGLRIAVTGCYATIDTQTLLGLPGVELVLPNARKESVLAEICAAVGSQPAGTAGTTTYRGKRTRAQVKIQDGCDNHCTYCVVRIARGAQRSIAPEHILAEVRTRLDEGYQEIVLTGVHIGAYGHDTAANATLPPGTGWSLGRLVEMLLEKTSLPRLRLSSIEPGDVTDELLSFWPNERLCRHLHLPIQSGDDAVLQRMGRDYDSRYLSTLVEKIRTRVPEMAITTDLIAGFPGESDRAHAATCRLVQRLQLARLHVFAFSARPGTLAAEMPDQLAPDIIKRRSQELNALGKEQACSFQQQHLGQTMKVLFESLRKQQGQPLWSGLTDNYLRVYTLTEQNLHNKFHDVRCTALAGDGILGELN